MYRLRHAPSTRSLLSLAVVLIQLTLTWAAPNDKYKLYKQCSEKTGSEEVSQTAKPGAYSTCTHFAGDQNCSLVTGLQINGTGLCGAYWDNNVLQKSWCCEYQWGQKPSVTGHVATTAWCILCFFGILSVVLALRQRYLKQKIWKDMNSTPPATPKTPRSPRTPVDSDLTKQLATWLLLLTFAVIAFCLAVNLLIYSLVVSQNGFGRQWAAALKPLLASFIAVDAVFAVFIIVVLAFGYLCYDPPYVNLLNEESRKATSETILKSCIYSVVSLCILLAIPERIVYDGVSGSVFSNSPLDAQGYNTNKNTLTDVNTLVDVLLGILVLPLAQSTVYIFVALADLFIMHLWAV